MIDLHRQYQIQWIIRSRTVRLLQTRGGAIGIDFDWGFLEEPRKALSECIKLLRLAIILRQGQGPNDSSRCCARRAFDDTQDVPYAKQEKLCGEKAIPRWDFNVESEAPRRKRLGPDDHIEFKRCLFRWAMVDSANSENAKTIYHRMLTLSEIRLVEATGMHSCEVFGLKNWCVRKKGDDYVVSIQAKTSKVRRSRDITVLADSFGDRFSRWQQYKDKDEYVFMRMFKLEGLGVPASSQTTLKTFCFGSLDDI